MTGATASPSYQQITWQSEDHVTVGKSRDVIVDTWHGKTEFGVVHAFVGGFTFSIQQTQVQRPQSQCSGLVSFPTWCEIISVSASQIVFLHAKLSIILFLIGCTRILHVQGDAVHVHRVVLATQSDALSELLPTTPDNGIMNWSAHCNDINDAKVSSLLHLLHDFTRLGPLSRWPVRKINSEYKLNQTFSSINWFWVCTDGWISYT